MDIRDHTSPKNNSGSCTINFSDHTILLDNYLTVLLRLPSSELAGSTFLNYLLPWERETVREALRQFPQTKTLKSTFTFHTEHTCDTIELRLTEAIVSQEWVTAGKGVLIVKAKQGLQKESQYTPHQGIKVRWQKHALCTSLACTTNQMQLWSWHIKECRLGFSFDEKGTLVKKGCYFSDFAASLFPEDRSAYYKDMEQFIKARSKNFQTCYRSNFFSSDHSYRWYEMTGEAFETTENKTCIQAIGILKDITELKKLRTTAENHRRQNAFLVEMTHEIRTPLNTIIGFSELVSETTDETERQEYIRIIKRNNSLLLQLVSDVLDLSKIESGMLEFDYGWSNVNELCREAIAEESCNSKGSIAVILDSGSEQCGIYSDSGKVIQILSKLINNALKFTYEGEVRVGYSFPNATEIEFYVQDTGIGVPQKEVSRLFERFTKLNPSSEGSGVGLSVCKSVIEQLGGTIGVDSQVGKGSRFWFRIPAKEDPQKESLYKV